MFDPARATVGAVAICSAPTTQRKELVDQVLEVDGVIIVREMMTGQQKILTNEEYSRPSIRLDAEG